MERLSKIYNLVDKVEKELNSEKNRMKNEKWNIPEVNFTYMHPIPKRRDQIPIIVDLEYPLWAKVLNFNVRNFYTDPVIFLEKQLEMSLFRYNYFQDDSGLGKTIAIWLGVNFEASILGCKSIYPQNFDPYVDRSLTIIKNEESLKELQDKEINFESDGILSLAHEFYSRIKEILPADWKVIFPDWVLGPLSIGIYLRGYENLLSDMMLNPEFFMKILDFISDKMIEYSCKRAKYLNINAEKFNLHNDDVNHLNLSREDYSKLVFPFENKLNSFYSGFQYWHSCGNVENFIDQILKFTKLSMLDCSGWNNLNVFIKAFRRNNIINTGIEKRFNPVKDVLNADEQSIRQKIKDFYIELEDNGKINISFKLDGIGEMHDYRENIAQVKKFVDIAKEFSFI